MAYFAEIAIVLLALIYFAPQIFNMVLQISLGVGHLLVTSLFNPSAWSKVSNGLFGTIVGDMVQFIHNAPQVYSAQATGYVTFQYYCGMLATFLTVALTWACSVVSYFVDWNIVSFSILGTFTVAISSICVRYVMFLYHQLHGSN